MARLSISCLGPLQVTLDEQPVTSFKSNRVRALLIHLVVESERPHRRETLASLLWPQWTDREALSNLRYALSNLRRALGDRKAEPPYLLITRDTLQFNISSDHRLDVASFLSATKIAKKKTIDSHDLSVVEEAVELYGGGFLEGFSVRDCPEYEEWVMLKRRQIEQELSTALCYLATSYEQNGKLEKAQTWARRRIELEPWDETAHQQLMRTLALVGDRSAALLQYETCEQLLMKELGVEPSLETTELYKQIRAGKLTGRPHTFTAVAEPSVSLPRFLEEAPPVVETAKFVGRVGELAQLEGLLNLALAGQGRVAFVIGEAGSGKTALLQGFAQRAQHLYPKLAVAGGNCNAHTGIGDPYLPFREILGLLTGDVEAQWAAGAITRERASRLWHMLPIAAQALVETGPDLIDTFVSRTPLLERASTCAQGSTNWLNRLTELIDRKPFTSPDALSLPQNDLFEQYTRLVQSLAQQSPLLLVLDDLQWADLGSISLLFHLGRRLVGSPILVIGAYRPEEVSIGRDGVRHPLSPVISEFQRGFGDITVNMSQSKGHDFIEALLDSEPNRLGLAFREMLLRQTRGHPLFTVELLRGLQERGDLTQDQQGRWIEGRSLNWETLPARVEAVIAERIGRLAQSLRTELRVASVQGEVFTAEVVARVQGREEREVVSHLSSELDRKHRLVRAHAIERLGSRRLSRYRFTNYLFQKYLYDSVDEVERAYLHEDVGNVLEDLYQEQDSETAAIAPQLAWHFQEAGISEKAIRYLQQAGERAVQLSAYDEGRIHLSKGLALLMSIPDSRERAQKEFDLQLSLAMAWTGEIPGREWETALGRARELGSEIGQTDQLCRVLGMTAIFHYVRAEHHRAQELAEEALSLAQHAADPLLVALGHWHLGFIFFALGEFKKSRTHLEQVISNYDPNQHHRPFVLLRGSDVGVSAMAYDACCLWCLGFPEQALKRSQEAIRLARELEHAFSLADVLCFGGCMLNDMRRDSPALQGNASELMQLSKGMGFSSFGGTAECYYGEALTRLGQVREGLVEISKGLSARQSVGARVCMTSLLSSLAVAQASLGDLKAGLTTLNEALEQVEETGERYWEAEIRRVRAQLHLMRGKEVEAETSLRQAIQVAQNQQAKSWELRAATDLARLWQEQGKEDEARELLGPVYNWFEEGHDTPDVTQARMLLKQLS